jgi:hypothetical protein
MASKTEPHVWVVEGSVAGRRPWTPIRGTNKPTKEENKSPCKWWRQQVPSDRFRVAKYQRVPAKGRKKKP